MSGAERRAALRRGADREREAAGVVGATRTRYRQKYESAPDMTAVVLPTGEIIQVEATTRRKLPRLLVTKIQQARRYRPGCVPLVAISEFGGEALAVLPLRDLARILGLQPKQLGEQLGLPLGVAR